jgi:hypothetical protein
MVISATEQPFQGADMATDNFQTLSDIPGAPSRAPFAVTPSDSVELSIIPKALYVGTGGTVILRGVGGAADVTFKNVANGPGARRARAICPRNRHHRRRHRGARLMSMFGFTTRRAAMRRRGGAGSGPVAGTSPTAFAVAPTVQYHPNSQTATLNGSNLVLDCADLKGLAPLTGGTPGSSGVVSVYFDTPTGIAAATAQTWAAAVYARISAGSATNISSQILAIDEITSGGAYVTGGSSSISLTGSLTAFSFARTLNGGATVAFIRPFVRFSVTSGLAIDITLRLGLPDLEQAASATTPTVVGPVQMTDARGRQVLALLAGAISAGFQCARQHQSPPVDAVRGVARAQGDEGRGRTALLHPLLRLYRRYDQHQPH